MLAAFPLSQSICLSLSQVVSCFLRKDDNMRSSIKLFILRYTSKGEYLLVQLNSDHYFQLQTSVLSCAVDFFLVGNFNNYGFN